VLLLLLLLLLLLQTAADCVCQDLLVQLWNTIIPKPSEQLI
jgi:hypothetical protein